MIQKYFLFLFFINLTFIFIECTNTREPNVVYRAGNMTESMKQDAIRITKQTFIKFNGYSIKDRSSMAKYITYEFNKLHKPSWQCIIGKDYGLSVTTENEKRIVLDVGNIAILIFKGKC